MNDVQVRGSATVAEVSIVLALLVNRRRAAAPDPAINSWRATRRAALAHQHSEEAVR
jgi:hypothetical protein